MKIFVSVSPPTTFLFFFLLFFSFLGHQKQIDPETFKDFYNYWKETEAEAQEVNLPPAVIEHLDKNECVYKLSCSVKTNYGVGKIALTQKRLFLLTEGGRPGYVQIAAFRDIEVSIQALLVLLHTYKYRPCSSLQKDLSVKVSVGTSGSTSEISSS